MINKPLNFRNVFKRKRCLSENKITYNRHRFFVRESVTYLDRSNFISELEKLYESNRFDILENNIDIAIDKVIPTIPNNNLDYTKSLIESSNIGDINKTKLIESINMYKSIDRIIKNHNNLSKKFTLENFTNKAKSDKDKFYSICEMVDTYNLSNYIKMNIVFEETMYVSYVENVPVNVSSLVENVLDYFLLKNDSTMQDIKSYNKAIQESKVLPTASNSNIQWFEDIISSEDFSNLNDYATYPPEIKSIFGEDWKDKLNSWKVSDNKNTDSLKGMLKENLNDINALRKIVETYNDYTNINNIESDYSDFIMPITESITGEEAHNILTLYKESGNNKDLTPIIESIVDIFIEETNNEVYDGGTTEPQSFTSDDIDKFKLHNLVTDAQSAGKFLDQIEKTSMKTFPVRMTTVFDIDYNKDVIDESSINNYIDNQDHLSLGIRSYSYNLDPSNSDDVNTVCEFAKSINNCINNILYNTDSKSYFILGEGSLDFYIRSKYEVHPTSVSDYNNRDFSKIDKKYINEIARYTDVLESMYNSPYFAIMEKLQDRYYAARISVDEFTLISDILSPYLVEEENALSEFVKLCEYEDNKYYKIIKNKYKSIIREDFNIYEDPSIRLNLCAEVMGITEDMVDKAVNNIKSSFKDAKNRITRKSIDKNQAKEDKKDKEEVKKNINNDNTTNDNQNDDDIDKDLEDLNNNNVPKNDAKAAASNTSKEDPTNTKSSDDSSESKSGSVDLESVKATWDKTKAKLKDASAKEKEISRDVDMTFNDLCSKLKSLVTVDHREGIIAGEVNKSLSKVIKMGIAFAGIGAVGSVALGAPSIAVVLPVLLVINKLVRSKFLSRKDKLMILDQIDVELKVLDREIAKAEQSGSNKKYRQLLTIQSNLRRRRQEIYFRLALKGKKLPMSNTAGLRERD